MLYDISNPTKATRVIYDGIPGSMKAITVAPGGEKKGVQLSDAIAGELLERNRLKPDSDLVVTRLSIANETPSSKVNNQRVSGRG
jgi:hypothetical protein